MMLLLTVTLVAIQQKTLIGIFLMFIFHSQSKGFCDGIRTHNHLALV